MVYIPITLPRLMNTRLGRYCYFLVLLLAGLNQARGQDKPLEVTLPPLPKLLQLAEEHAPRLKQQQSFSDQFEQGMLLSKKKWTDKVFVDIGAQTSNNGAVLNVNNTISAGEVTSLSFQNINSVRAGLTVRLSVFDFYGRKNQVLESKALWDASRHMEDLVRLEVREKTIQLYKDIEISGRVLTIQAEKKFALYTQKLFAEKQFQAGQIPMEEFTRVVELYSLAAISYEEAKGRYETLLMQLENWVGTPLKNIR